MVQKVFLHIGAMKTGTTYLQRLMEVNADSLDRAGCLFPVTGGWSSQVMAVRDVLGQTHDPRVRLRAEGAWQRMTEHMMNYEGSTAILSMEFLSFAKPAGVQRIAASFEGVELHVILTVRDTAGVIPAQWQSSVRNGHVTSWPDFVDQVTSGRAGTGTDGRKIIQRAQNVHRMLQRWLQIVPPERFHVVTVPPSDAPRSRLWERFASVIGVDPAVCSEPAPRSNTSLGHASTGLIRLISLELGHLTVSERRTIKYQLATKTLSERASLEPHARTNAALREFAAQKNRRMRKSIRAAGVDVVGDLNDLPTSIALHDDDRPDDDVESAHRDDMLDAAQFALPRMRDLVDRRATALRESGLAPDDALERLPQPAPTDSEDPLDAAVKELAGVIRVAIELYVRQLDANLPIEDAPTGDAHPEDAHPDDIVD